MMMMMMMMPGCDVHFNPIIRPQFNSYISMLAILIVPHQWWVEYQSDSF